MKKRVVVDGKSLTIEDVVAVAREGAEVVIPDEPSVEVAKNRKVVDDIVAEGRVAYGITTGFGSLVTEGITKEQTELLQYNIVWSHSVGLGDPLEEEIVRAVMCLKTNMIAKACEGISIEAWEKVVELLNKGVHPVTPRQGGILTWGSSLVLVMIGEGEAFYKGQRMHGAEALKKAGIEPYRLKAREGLGLIGNSYAAAFLSLLVHDIERLLRNADIIGAMSLEALAGCWGAFDEKLHRVRPFKSNLEVAENMRLLTAGSEIMAAQKERVQDAISLRTIPHDHGAARDLLSWVRETLEIAINSSYVNPVIVTEENRAISGASSHPSPILLGADSLCMAITSVGRKSERRIYRLLDPLETPGTTFGKLGSGLPRFLVENPGVNSGFMIPQYVATWLVMENRTLSVPTVVDSIPVCGGQEDDSFHEYPTFEKLTKILRNVESILGIELLCASQALEFRKPMKPGVATAKIYEEVRKVIPKLEKDRYIYPDIERAIKLVRSGRLIEVAEKAIGRKLN